MSRENTFTIVPNQLIEGIAALCLSPKAFVVLMYAWRRWQFATRNGQQMCGFINLTWTSCLRVMSRGTFSAARRELVRKGFLEPVSASLGRYKFTVRWKSYTPSERELALLAKHKEARRERARHTRGYRHTYQRTRRRR